MRAMNTLPTVRTLAVPLAKIIENICEKRESTIIIACHSRTRFLEQLVEQTSQRETHQAAHPSSPGNLQDAIDEEEDDHQPSHLPTINPLLLPTLRLLAASSQVKIVFCPTIPTFRAYVSTLPMNLAGVEPAVVKLVILDVLALHLGTSEFTVQGLARSFSSIATLNNGYFGKVELLECRDPTDEPDQQNNSLSWKTEVPLLSGSIKIGDAGQGWANRTVSINKFTDRWFHFE